jgi:hypothetical protein
MCSFGLGSCVDLDLEPKGQYGEAEFFGSESGVETFFAGMYGWLPIEDFLFRADDPSNPNDAGYRKGNYNGYDAWGTWEAQKHQLATMCGEFIGPDQVNNNGANFWRYDRIRDINSFINSFPQYKENFDETKYNELLGEARFLRAFIFSGLVKRYGGVPIITEIQDPAADTEILNVPRNTEYDCWKFIYEDLKFAGENMTSAPDKYRGTKWTALALQSRLMLWAATIAKYTQYVNYTGEEAYDRGFAGMSADRANEFFQYSFDASKELIENGPYELYKANPDLAQNFHDLFFDENSNETIFFKNYIHHDIFPREAWLIGHSYDALMLPTPTMSNFVGSQAYPSLDAMRRFEGVPSLVDATGAPRRWENPADFRNELEPRMRGSMYLSGDNYQGIVFNIRRGLYKTFTWQASEILNGGGNEAPNLNGNRVLSNDVNATYSDGIDPSKNTHIPINSNGSINIIGMQGMRNTGGAENNCLTGGYVRKYIDETRELGRIVEHSSFQPWIVFRLAEIYLNHAEAAYEMGNREEANKYIREIRQRAGCKNLDISTNPADLDQWDYSKTQVVYPIDPGLQFIRDERYRELWGENQRWWDLKRWRVADRILEQWIPRILTCYYVVDEDRYIFLDEREQSTRTYNANRSCYYQSIPGDEINKNPNLLPQNPFR